MTVTDGKFIDRRQFTSHEIAVMTARRLGRDNRRALDNWHALVAERGIELAKDSSYTITTEGGQTFHVTVREVGGVS